MPNDENEIKYRKIFSSRLRALRLKSNMSQQKLAQKIGISRNEVLRWENQKRLPTFKSLVELANVFQVSASIFFIPNDITELEDIIKTFHILENP